jgi:hypothetical protein
MVGWHDECWQKLADSLQCCPLGESGAVADDSVSEAHTFIHLPLGGTQTTWRWSCSYERWLGSACVDVQTARLQAELYKYHLFLLHCVSCLFCTVGGSHK